MPIQEMTYVAHPITDADLARLEKELGASLPASYREFLLRHNGGRPEPPYFRNEVLSEFFSVDHEDPLYDLLANRRHLMRAEPVEMRLPSEMIPIGGDECGNYICLALKGENRGKVYFWDHEGGIAVDPWLKFKDVISGEATKPASGLLPLDWPGHPELWLVADSFEEFLESFHEWTYEPEEPDETGAP